MVQGESGQNCIRCGRWIQPSTAVKHEGRCVPCSRGETAHLYSSVGHDHRSSMKPLSQPVLSERTRIRSNVTKPRNPALQKLLDSTSGMGMGLFIFIAAVLMFAIWTDPFLGLGNRFLMPTLKSPWVAYPLGTLLIGITLSRGIFAAVRLFKIKPFPGLAYTLAACGFLATVGLVVAFELIVIGKSKILLGLNYSTWVATFINVYATFIVFGASYFSAKAALAMSRESHVWKDNYGILDLTGDVASTAGEIYTAVGGKPLSNMGSGMNAIGSGQWIPRMPLTSEVGALCGQVGTQDSGSIGGQGIGD